MRRPEARRLTPAARCPTPAGRGARAAPPRAARSALAQPRCRRSRAGSRSGEGTRSAFHARRPPARAHRALGRNRPPVRRADLGRGRDRHLPGGIPARREHHRPPAHPHRHRRAGVHGELRGRRTGGAGRLGGRGLGAGRPPRACPRSAHDHRLRSVRARDRGRAHPLLLGRVARVRRARDPGGHDRARCRGDLLVRPARLRPPALGPTSSGSSFCTYSGSAPLSS